MPFNYMRLRKTGLYASHIHYRLFTRISPGIPKSSVMRCRNAETFVAALTENSAAMEPRVTSCTWKRIENI